MKSQNETTADDLVRELRDFLKKRREGKKKKLYPSKLDRYSHELHALADEGASLAKLQTWLKTKRVNVARSTIQMFLKRGQPSKLDHYADELVLLDEMGATLPDLQAWLRSQGVKIGQTAIWMALQGWERDRDRAEPHFLSPNWTPKTRQSAQESASSKNATMPSSNHHQ